MENQDLDQLEGNLKSFLPFIDPRLRVGWHESLGHGVFASAPIRNGEFIEVAPVILIKSMPEDNLANYVVAWENGLAVPLGWTMLYNHSDENCCEYSINIQDRLFAIVAVKDIAENQHITVNYGPNWFSSRNIEKFLL